MAEVIVIGNKSIELDLDKELSVSEDNLVTEMYNQAGKFAWWGTLFVQAKKRLRELETVAYARYEAHIKEVAKKYLEATAPKKKPTLEAIANKAIEIWSDLSEDNKVSIILDILNPEEGEEVSENTINILMKELFPEEFNITWKEWQDRLIEAKFNVDILGIMVESLRQKKDMLQSIGAMVRSDKDMIGD